MVDEREYQKVQMKPPIEVLGIRKKWKMNWESNAKHQKPQMHYSDQKGNPRTNSLFSFPSNEKYSFFSTKTSIFLPAYRKLDC